MDHAIASMRVIHASRNEAINGATKRVYVALSQRFHALRAVTTSMLGGSYFYVAQYGLRFTAIGRISASRGCLYAFVLSFKLPRGQYPFRNGWSLRRGVLSCKLSFTWDPVEQRVQVLDCACIHFDVTTIKRLREGHGMYLLIRRRRDTQYAKMVYPLKWPTRITASIVRAISLSLSLSLSLSFSSI